VGIRLPLRRSAAWFKQATAAVPGSGRDAEFPQVEWRRVVKGAPPWLLRDRLSKVFLTQNILLCTLM